MAVRFEEQERAVVAYLSGDYTVRDIYIQDYGTICKQIETQPRTLLINLGGIININVHSLANLERLAWKVAKDLEQYIRFADPSASVRQLLSRLNKSSFNIPIFGSLDAAIKNIEENNDQFDELFS